MQLELKRKNNRMEQALSARELTIGLMKEIKMIVRTALIKSNECAHTTTSEWVKVRIITAKTYWLELKLNKAIAILTDLCYVIPPDMLKINQDNANLALYEYD
jgi:hypothetical protein